MDIILRKQYFKHAALLALIIAVTMRFEMVLSYLSNDMLGYARHKFNVTLIHLGSDIAILYVVALLMFILNYYILRPDEKQNRLKPGRVALAVLLTFFTITVLNTFLFSLKNLIDPASIPRGHRSEFDLRNFFVSGLVVGSVLIIRLISQKQTIMVENETLKRESLQSQYESLKNQLSPHFLFNSLTALQVLIKEDPDKAQSYVNSLSKALRYTLQSNEKQLVTMREEMNFMESYIHLLRIRFDTSLNVEIAMHDEFYVYKLPPLTIQTLVENAVKHNEISKKKPLVIKITTSEDGSLTVSNVINEKFDLKTLNHSV
ncbi:MAG: histidine kinase [Bacteroidales bacterium]|nr:histidine kinase [Bacteroidales bacterium]